jgi:hypothetical protein
MATAPSLSAAFTAAAFICFATCLAAARFIDAVRAGNDAPSDSGNGAIGGESGAAAPWPVDGLSS